MPYAPSPEARQEKAPTARERAYLRAVDVLYGEGPKERLDTLYSNEMGELAATYSGDHINVNIFGMTGFVNLHGST